MCPESEALYDDYEALKSGRKSEVEIAEEGKGTGTVPTNGNIHLFSTILIWYVHHY